jgi:hypothetical protein
MPQFIDLTGKRFNKLVVLRRNSQNNKFNHIRWDCECDCGNFPTVNGGQLKRQQGCNKCYAKGIPYNWLMNHISKSAARKSYEMSITYEELLGFIKEGKCHYCHTPLCWNQYTPRGKRTNQGYQLDRKDNSKGYITGNIVPCCWRCNDGKGSRFTYDEWYSMTEVFRNARIS